MGSNDPAFKQYIRSISHALPCSGKMKRQIISQIRDSIVDYLQENPSADFAAVQAHFGTKQEIVSSYVNYEDTSVLLRKMSIKKKVLVIVAGVMTAMLLLWLGSVSWIMIDAQKTNRGHIVETTEMN